MTIDNKIRDDSLLGKAFEKRTKTIEDQGKNQIKAIEDHGKQLSESYKVIKKGFNIDRDSISLDEQKRYLIKLLKKNLMNLRIQKKKLILII